MVVWLHGWLHGWLLLLLVRALATPPSEPWLDPAELKRAEDDPDLDGADLAAADGAVQPYRAVQEALQVARLGAAVNRCHPLAHQHSSSGISFCTAILVAL